MTIPYWDVWRDRIATALDGDTLERVEAEIEAGRAQFWPGEGGAIITQCVANADGRFLHVWLGAGEMAELLALKPGIEAWGRAQGCEFASINGRPGWARVHRDFEMVDGELRKAL